MVEPRAAMIDWNDVIDFGRGHMFVALLAMRAEGVTCQVPSPQSLPCSVVAPLRRAGSIFDPLRTALVLSLVMSPESGGHVVSSVTYAVASCEGILDGYTTLYRWVQARSTCWKQSNESSLPVYRC